MSTKLLPQSFWFQLAFRCPRVDRMVVEGDESRLISLPDSCRLPALAELDGKQPWLDLWAGWNPRGLGLSFRARGVREDQLTPAKSGGSVSLVVLIDTRDTRDLSRASRHCHRFMVEMDLKPGRVPEARVVQKPIARATSDAPIAPRDKTTARGWLTEGAWRLDLLFQSEALHGFDPETNRRLGLAYRVSDQIHDDQYLGVGREFPIEENPSLWSTLELVD